MFWELTFIIFALQLALLDAQSSLHRSFIEWKQ